LFLFKWFKTSSILILALLFFILEEIIWKITKKIYKKIENNIFFDYIAILIPNLDRYLILLLFIVPFLLSESLSIFALNLFSDGKVKLGILVTILRIPVAFLSLVIFKSGKEELLTFILLKKIYEYKIKLIEFLKSFLGQYLNKIRVSITNGKRTIITIARRFKNSKTNKDKI